MYEVIKKQLPALFDNIDNFITNASGFLAVIYHSLPDINWIGFYLANGSDLIAGPYQGKVACVKIPIGKGVCGACAGLKEIITVDDVGEFRGHIACDPMSKSEIVLPVIVNGTLLGVLDIDSPVRTRFNEYDKQNLAGLLDILINSSDMDKFKQYLESK